MRGVRNGSAFRMSRWQTEVLTALVWALGLLPMWSVVPVFAQSAQVGTAQNAIGTLVVVRPDGIEDRLQAKGSLQLFEGDVFLT